MLRDPATGITLGRDEIALALDLLSSAVRSLPKDDASFQAIGPKKELKGIIAWNYELAHSIDQNGNGADWRRQISFNRPSAPDHVIRKLTPLVDARVLAYPSEEAIVAADKAMRNKIVTGDRRLLTICDGLSAALATMLSDEAIVELNTLAKKEV